MLRAVQSFGKRIGLFGLCLIVVIAIRLVLSIASHRAVVGFVPSGRTRLAHPAMAWRISAAVANVARFVPQASCLTQALSVQLLLAWRGFASDVKVGVKRGAGGEFEAHAWLVSGGQIAIGGTAAEIAEFVPLTDFRGR